MASTENNTVPVPRSWIQSLQAWNLWFNTLNEPRHQSWCRGIVNRRAFVLLTSLVIGGHAVFVTIVCDWEISHLGKPQPLVFVVGEMIFLSFYTLELLMKIESHRIHFFLNESAAWNIFDLVLVLFSISDLVWWAVRVQDNKRGGSITFMRIFRLLKVAKILRTIRVIRLFRELSMIMESFRMCLVSMVWALLSLGFMLFIFSLVFVQGMSGHLSAGAPEDEVELVMGSFGSVSAAMLSLYMSVTGGNDWSYYYDVVGAGGRMYSALYLLYTFFFMFALFNILTGVFVEKAMAAGLPNRDELILEERKKLLSQVEEFRALCKRLDTDKSGTISQLEFNEHMKDEMMISYMSSVGLELYDAELFFETVAGLRMEVAILKQISGASQGASC